jgi:nucleoside-diphosphate-sugar epimerase
MNVLVVGGAGYVGGFFVDELMKSSHSIRVLDNLTYDDFYFKDVDFFNVNILDSTNMISHFKWADMVVWLAALVGDPACALNPSLTIDTNVNSLKNLLANFSGPIIFLSTCSVYGAQDGILTEESKLNPLSLYAQTKIEAEKLIINAKNPFVIFRLGTLFGISDSYSRLRADLVVNILTIRSYLEGKMNVFGGAQFRPLLHVRDVTTAINLTIDNFHQGVFNIHSENLTIFQIAERVKIQLPDTQIVTNEMSFQDSRNYRVSSELAEKTFGFKPEFSIEYGINQIIALLSRGRIRDINNPRFSNAIALREIHGH